MKSRAFSRLLAVWFPALLVAGSFLLTSGSGTFAATTPVAATAAPAESATAARTAGKADLILINGKVLTMDGTDSVAEAVAVGGERIVAVGTSAAMRALAAPGARVIDLQGKTLLPGFIDSRLHGPLGFWELSLGAALTDKEGRPLGRVEEIEAHLKAWTAEHRPAPYSWVVAAGFDPKLSASRKFDRDWADQLFPDNPLILLSLDHHAALLNSRAIDLVKLKDLVVPAGGGEVVKDGQGRPSGLVRELPAFLVLDRVWALLPEDTRREATTRFLDTAGRFGVTTVGDPLMTPAGLTLADSLLRDKELPVRLVAGTLRADTESFPAFDAYRKEQRSPDPDRLSVGPPLEILDGTLLGWGAAQFQVYRDSAWTSGFLTMTPETITSSLASGAGDGGLLVEATGGLAVHLFLDAFDRLPAVPRSGALLRADSLQIVSEGDRDRLAGAARRGLVVSLQPTRFPYRLYMRDSLGDERLQAAMPYKTLLASGVPIAINSDWPMSAQTFQPTQVLEWAVTRAGLDAREGLTIAQALRAYTAGAAQALGLQTKVGSIEPGKRADFVVLDQNPLDLAATPERLSDVPVRMTFSSGALVFEDRRVAEARPATAANGAR